MTSQVHHKKKAGPSVRRSQSPDGRLQPERTVNCNASSANYLSDESDSCEDYPRSVVEQTTAPPKNLNYAKRPREPTINREDEVTVSGEQLYKMETMIKNLQDRLDLRDRGRRSVSTSRSPLRRRSIDSYSSRDESLVRDRRRRRRSPSVIKIVGDPSAAVAPVRSSYSPPPPPAPPGSAFPPLDRGCVPIAEGLPKPEIARWRQCANEFGNSEWHVDYDTPEATTAPKDLSHKSILTVIREFDSNGRFWRRRIKIVSPAVIDLLEDLDRYDFKTNPEDGPRDGNLRLTEPFMALFHNRYQLQDKAVTASWPVRQQVQFVLDFMRNEFVDETRTLDDIESTKPSGLISFPELFLLYRPGTIVYSLENGEYEAFVVDSIRGMQKKVGGDHGRLHVTCWSIDYDGEVFGRVWSTHKITPFHGSRQINSLDLVPEVFLPNAHEVKWRLRCRGGSFWSLQGQKFLEYTGEVWSQTPKEEAVRVMVDCLTYQRRNKWPISIDKKRGPYSAQSKNWRENRFARSKRRGRRAPSYCSMPVVSRHDDYSPDGSRERQAYTYRRFPTGPPAYEAESVHDKYNLLNPDTVPDELTVLLCPQYVHGYCLREKVWTNLNVSQLRPVNFRTNAWDRLVLDQEYKDIVQAMVSSYVSKTATLDDLIAGKGAGLVALLHGPPGSGKTLTAECVADSFEKPLYQVTCGDIGTDPEGLEDRLEEIFDYAVTWGAILLLDEADIFLQDRDYANLERNALVSIFLRTLEYFNGVLFLTTNRVGAFDQAFQSRIHVTLGLPSLDQQSRISVWAIFLEDLAAKGAISGAQHTALMKKVDAKWSMERLNGRQIRNTVRTALVLAEKKGAVVGEAEFETVLRIGREFEGYMGMLGKGEGSVGVEGFQEV